MSFNKMLYLEHYILCDKMGSHNGIKKLCSKLALIQRISDITTARLPEMMD